MPGKQRPGFSGKSRLTLKRPSERKSPFVVVRTPEKIVSVNSRLFDTQIKAEIVKVIERAKVPEQAAAELSPQAKKNLVGILRKHREKFVRVPTAKHGFVRFKNGFCKLSLNEKALRRYVFFGFGKTVIDSGAFFKWAEKNFKGITLNAVKDAFYESIGISRKDHFYSGLIPHLGSKGGVSVEVSEKGKLTNATSFGLIVPTLGLSAETITKSKHSAYMNLIINARKVLGSQTVFELRIPAEDRVIASFLESRFIVSETVKLSELYSLKIDFRKRFVRKK
ncbi:MAG: hypothetical protein ABH986_01295 [archaeon]